jgi:hypothetical protein
VPSIGNFDGVLVGYTITTIETYGSVILLPVYRENPISLTSIKVFDFSQSGKVVFKRFNIRIGSRKMNLQAHS